MQVRITLKAPALAGIFVTLLAALTGCGPREITVDSHPAAQAPAAGRIVFLAGPDSHGPLAHEHEAGSRLLARVVRERRPDVETVNIYGGWPVDESVFDGASAVVMYCDGGQRHLVNEHLASFNRLVDAGVGIVALHYCVEVPKGSPSATAILAAIGGYFETDWSVNPHWEANFRRIPVHPVTAGVQAFTLLDEWYFNMRFVPDMTGVTPILSAVAPQHTMERKNGPHSGNDAVRRLVADGVPQVVAWAYERPGGGRGFGYTGGHFHANWDNDNTRNLVTNAILWSAGMTPTATSPEKSGVQANALHER
jgi:type 1 glutamine amidotransferase